MPILAQRLRELRKQRGLTQSQIAELLGINRVTYTGYEIGKHQPPLEILVKISDILQTSSDYLLGRYN